MVRESFRFACPVVVAVVLIGGCRDDVQDDAASGPAESPANANLHEEAAKLQERLVRLEQQIADSEVRAARAKEEARFYDCKASVERVNAEARAAQASCLNSLAQQAACAAEVERGKGDASLFGAMLGIAFAIGTGGSGTPWALGGAFAGRGAGELMGRECPQPECADNFDDIYANQLRKQGWETLPQCGGWVGIDVETPSLGLQGGCAIEEPGAMAAAGLQAGDFVAFIDGQRVKSADECSAALQTAFSAMTADGEAQLKFVRGERMYLARLSLQRKYHAQLRSAGAAAHRYGVRVTGIHTEGTLGESTTVGDTIFSVDGVELVDSEHFRSVLRYRRAGETLSMTLHRSGVEPRTVEVTLIDRGERRGI